MPTLDRDGVKLFYEEAGAGDPPIVFVHGWTCNHTYFAPQYDHFAANHRVITVDLRGHGDSDKPEQDYTIAGFADDVAWLCGEIGVQQPVVVGHSMGAAIALELARRQPSVARAAVLVDAAPIVLSPELTGTLQGMVAGMQSADHLTVRRGFVDGFLFAAYDDPVRKSQIADDMLGAPQHVAVSCMNAIGSWDGADAARECAIPALHIGADQPINDATTLRGLNPLIATGQTVGAGHFNQLFAADQVTAMITSFLRINGIRT